MLRSAKNIAKRAATYGSGYGKSKKPPEIIQPPPSPWVMGEDGTWALVKNGQTYVTHYATDMVYGGKNMEDAMRKYRIYESLKALKG